MITNSLTQIPAGVRGQCPKCCVCDINYRRHPFVEPRLSVAEQAVVAEKIVLRTCKGVGFTRYS